MRLVSGIASIVLVAGAGCTLEATDSPFTFLGSAPLGGKADGSDVAESFYDDYSGEIIVQFVDRSNADDPYVYDEKVMAMLDDGTLQWISTFPGKGYLTTALYYDTDGTTVTSAVIDSVPPTENLDLVLAQMASAQTDLVGDYGSTGGDQYADNGEYSDYYGDEYGKADVNGQPSCSPAGMLVKCGSGLAGALVGVGTLVGTTAGWFAWTGWGVVIAGAGFVTASIAGHYCMDSYEDMSTRCVPGGTGGTRTPEGNTDYRTPSGAYRQPRVYDQPPPPNREAARGTFERRPERGGGRVLEYRPRRCSPELMGRDPNCGGR